MQFHFATWLSSTLGTHNCYNYPLPQQHNSHSAGHHGYAAMRCARMLHSGQDPLSRATAAHALHMYPWPQLMNRYLEPEVVMAAVQLTHVALGSVASHGRALQFQRNHLSGFSGPSRTGTP